MLTSSSIVAAVRAFTRINNEGEWVEPTKHVIITHISISEDFHASPIAEEKIEDADSRPANQAEEIDVNGAEISPGRPEGPAEDAEAPKENRE